MIVTIGHGDIFSSDADAIVNPVNCEGIMGGGLAREFARRYPSMNREYRSACLKGALRPGQIFTSLVDGPDYRPLWVFNFPTKDQIQNPSLLEYIEMGMEALTIAVDELSIKSIGIPALGCGLGGLEWYEVLPIIVRHCRTGHMRDVRVHIYEPQEG